MGKLTFVIVMMIVAIYMYLSKYRKCTMIPIILSFFIVCVSHCSLLRLTSVSFSQQLLSLLMLDLSSKYIAGFFILIYLANLFNFLGFYKILDTLPGAPGEKMRRRTRCYFVFMILLYIATLALAFVPRFGPFCTSEKLYPPVLNWTACLFLINYVFHLVMNCRKDYFLAEGHIAGHGESAVEELHNFDEQVDNMSQLSEGQREQLLNWRDGQQADKLAKEMFRK